MEDRTQCVDSCSHYCQYCKEAFASRNALFRHLRESCDPTLVNNKDKDRKERVVLVIGYVGSKYFGCKQNQEKDELKAPTVEGVVLAAVRRAWECDVLGVTRSTRTERSSHAVENVLVLTVRKGGEREDSALRRELQGSDIWLLAPAGSIAPPVLFDKVYAAKKRVHRVYIPYWALSRTPDFVGDPDPKTSSLMRDGNVRFGERSGAGLWICNVLPTKSEECMIADIQAMIGSCGLEVPLESIEYDLDAGQALLHVSDETANMMSSKLYCRFLNGAKIAAIPLPEARAKLALQKKIRSVLKILRGPAKGLRSFHNFMQDTTPGDISAMRQLQKVQSSSLDQDVLPPRQSPVESTWLETDWTYVSFSAADFAPQQLRRMASTVVAVVRGAEKLEYVNRCFTDPIVNVIPAPAEAVTLESVTFGQWDSDWRAAVNFQSEEKDRVRGEITARLLQDASLPWKDVIARIDAGGTRTHCNSKLFAAALEGHADEVLLAMNKGAQIDAVDEYGRTAVFMAAHIGHTTVVECLAHRKADLEKLANGGASPYLAAAAAGHKSVLEVLKSHGAGSRCERSFANPVSCLADEIEQPTECTRHNQICITEIIPYTSSHAGAGTVTIDNAFREQFLDRLEALWQNLPLAPKEKLSPTERAYYADAEGWVTKEIDAAIVAAHLRGATLPLMRFLIYPTVGGHLPPHVDLPRTDAQGVRSTHTFLLYLRDCSQGGETRFLEALDGDDALASSGGLAAGERQEIAATIPRRGRLLLMPHACPHEAAPTVDAPKVLVRGEVRIV